jgi:REP element-mobilizing transposase RayT
MSRGNRKSSIFSDDVDRRYLLETVASTVRRYHVRVYAACLMGNHYHLVFDMPYGTRPDPVDKFTA